MKKILYSFILLSMILLVAGCAAKEKTYESHGIKITMQEGFNEKSLVSATVYLESIDSIFTALKEEFTILGQAGLDKDSTIEEYLTLVNAANNANYEIKTSGDLKYFTYESDVSGKTFYYLATAYKTDDAFWLCNFAAEAKNKEKFEPLFLKWAKTVEFE